MEFRILGPLEVRDGENPVAIHGAKQRALLAILLLHANKVVPVERLIDELWGERPPETAAKSLQVYVSRLRKALRVDGAEDPGGGILVTRPRGYMIQVGPGDVDLERFEGSLAAGEKARRDGDAKRAAAQLSEALALWRGAPLGDVDFGSVGRHDAERLDELRLRAQEQLIEAKLALGQHAEVIGELEALIAKHPLRERFRAQLMLALYRSGRQAEALEAYRRTHRTMADELGLEPGAEVRELEQAMLRQDPHLDLAPAGAVEPPPAADRAPPQRATPPTRPSRPALAVAAFLAAATIAAALVAVLATGSDSPRVIDGNTVGVIDPGTNEVIGGVPVGTQPRDLAAAEGAVWVANVGDSTVSQIDPRARRVAATIAPGISVDGMAAGEGAVWTADVARGRMARIDPTLRRVDRSIRIGRAPLQAQGVRAPVATGGSSVWVSTGKAMVARIDPRGRRVASRTSVGNDPSGIAVGSGAVWVVDDEDHTVTRIDPATGGVLATIPVGQGASGIAAGAGAVWVAEPFDDAVARIDPRTNSVSDTIAVGDAPGGVAVGAGAVWVANGGDGSVSRVDPRTRRVTATITVGGSPQSLVVADGMVWVSVQPAPAAPSGDLDESTARIFAEGPGDPALAGPSPTAYATCGQLLAYPDKPFPQGSHLRPEVARAMPELTDGRTTYTYRLRHGFRFSPPSNQPVTADAFRRAIERSLDPRMHSYGLELLSDVVGYRAYEAGRARHLAGVVARGDVLRIQLTAPSPTFPARLAAVYFCAVPPNTPVDPGGIDAIPSAGRYYVASSDPDGGAVLKRNPGYGGEHPGRLAEIELLSEVPQAEAIADVEAGRADLLDLSPQESGARRIQTEYGPGGPQAASRRYLSTPTLTLHYLALNTDREPFSDVRARRAANYAIDRRALVRRPLPSGSGRPTDQYIPPGMPGFRDAVIYPLGGPDIAKARRLAPADHGTAVMYTCNDDSCRHNAEVVRANLKRIGIDVRIHQFPYAALYDRLLAPLKAGRTGAWDIADVGWINDYADPEGELNPLFEVGHAGESSNYGHFDDARFQRDLRHAAALSGPRRDRAYARLDAALARDAAPVIAYANETTEYFFSARIGCQVVQPLYGLDLAALCVRP